MKHWMLALAIASAIGGVTGCSSGAQTPGKNVTAAPQGASGVKEEDVQVAAPEAAVPNLDAIAISGAKVTNLPGDTKGERLWEVVATIRNGSKAPLPGLELVADLSTEGEALAFARSSAEVRFETPLMPGETFMWRSLSPVDGDVGKAPVSVAVKATRWLDVAKVESGGWKPLDPKTATPKTVGEPITIPAGPSSGSDSAR